MRTKIALLLIFIIAASSFFMIQPAQNQISPPTPEFSLKIEDRSYGVTNASGTYHIPIKFVEVVIKNTVPYTFYAVVNDTLVKLYYNIRYKPHALDWANATVTPNLAPLDANYTIVKFGIGTNNPDPGGWSIWLGNTTISGQVDFQVLGVDGFYTKLTAENPPCWRIPELSHFNETGRSQWAATQTIMLPGT